VSPVIVSIGRRYGRHDHSRSKVDTWAWWSWRERDAQKRSRGLTRLQTFRSATWGPSIATLRKIWLARTGHARPERRGMTNRSTSVRLPASGARRA
jgi:hypothetical protein